MLYYMFDERIWINSFVNFPLSIIANWIQNNFWRIIIIQSPVIRVWHCSIPSEGQNCIPVASKALRRRSLLHFVWHPAVMIEAILLLPVFEILFDDTFLGQNFGLYHCQFIHVNVLVSFCWHFLLIDAYGLSKTFLTSSVGRSTNCMDLPSCVVSFC